MQLSDILRKCLLLLTCAALRTFGSTQPNSYHKNRAQYGKDCEDNFNSHLNKCMIPFSRNVHLYTTTRLQNPIINSIFVKHVCRRYKKMLLCIHTVLTNCQNMDNIHQVQGRLEKPWVLTVNNMCNIKLNSNSNTQPRGNNSSETDSKEFSLLGGDISVVRYDTKQADTPHLTIPKDKSTVSQDKRDVLYDLLRETVPQLITVIKYNVSQTKHSSDIQTMPMNSKNLNSLFTKIGKNSVFLQLLYISVNDGRSDTDSETSLQLMSHAGTSYHRTQWIAVLLVCFATWNLL